MATRRKHIPRPDQVVVGHRTYAIRWMEDEEWKEPDNSDTERGTTHHIPQEIRIRLGRGQDRMTDESMREVLLHEILHACAMSSMSWVAHDQMSKKDRDPENIEELHIATWTPYLLMTLRQNSDVLAYLLDDQEHE